LQLSIRSTLILFMVACLLAMSLLLTLGNYSMMKRITSDYAEIYMRQTTKSVANEIALSLSNSQSLVTRIVNSNAINQHIISDLAIGPSEQSSLEAYRERNLLGDAVYEFYNDWQQVRFIGLYFNQKRYYFGKVGNPDFYDEIAQHIDPLLNGVKVPSVARISIQRSDLTILLRPISDLQTGQLLYWVVMALDLSRVSTLLTNGQLGETGRLQLVADDLSVLYPLSAEQEPRWQEVYRILTKSPGIKNNWRSSGMFTAKNLQIITERNGLYGWYLVGYVPVDELTKHVFSLWTFLLLPLLGILTAILFSVLMAHSITKPIYRIVEAMHGVEDKKYDLLPGDRSFKETQYISDQFNVMMTYIDRLLNEVHAAELERKDAEFASLQAQIRPHFIYNTLENINMMMLVRGQADISKVVVDLADILRYNNNSASKQVQLSEDIAQVEKYLHIQQFRFGDKLRYNIRMQPETRNLMIDKLLIQPIVENSVVHGIGSRLEGGTIEITTALQDGQLLIYICDDGVGFDANALPMHAPHQQIFGEGGHIGLGNVMSRIRHYYGDEYGVRIERLEASTRVTLHLPAREEKA